MEELVESVRREFLKLVEQGILNDSVVEVLKRIQYPWEFLNITDRLGEYFRYEETHIPSSMSAYVVIEGLVYIDDTADIGPFTHIKGPVIIGPKCRVHDCLVRHGTILFGNNHVGKATEVKNGILLPESNAPHQNYVGDSVLGYNCNLGAGTKIGNLRFDEREIELRYKDRKFQTGRKKFGAILEKGVQTGCNSDINPGTYATEGSFIFPAESVRGFIDRSKR